MYRRKPRRAHRSRTRLGALGGDRNRPEGPSRERDKSRQRTTVPGLDRRTHRKPRGSPQKSYMPSADPGRFHLGRSHSHRAAGYRPPSRRRPRESFRHPGRGRGRGTPLDFCAKREPLGHVTGTAYLRSPGLTGIITIGAGSHAGCGGVCLCRVENIVLRASRAIQTYDSQCERKRNAGETLSIALRDGPYHADPPPTHPLALSISASGLVPAVATLPKQRSQKRNLWPSFRSRVAPPFDGARDFYPTSESRLTPNCHLPIVRQPGRQ